MLRVYVDASTELPLILQSSVDLRSWTDVPDWAPDPKPGILSLSIAPQDFARFFRLSVRSFDTLYVSKSSVSPTPPFSSWATAARTIQDAVDVAAAGDEILVTNGVYSRGGRAVETWYPYATLSNRVAVRRRITIRSVNGPQATFIEGEKRTYEYPRADGSRAVYYSGMRCVYLGDGAVLSGFTLTNGANINSVIFYHYGHGAGVWCATTNAILTNCVIINNSANDSGGGYSAIEPPWCCRGASGCSHGPGSGSGFLSRSTLQRT
jgi:hypothetical protein